MNESIKINMFTISLIIIIVACIPIILISEILNYRTISFITETIAVTVYSLMFIYYLGAGIKNKNKMKKIIIISIKIILIVLFLYFLSPDLIKRYMDFPSAITRDYVYKEGIAIKRTFGTKGLVKFELNGVRFSINSYNYNHILKENYYDDIYVKVWYLPKSKYIIDIK